MTFKDSVSLLHAIFRRIGGNTKVLKKILLGNLCAVFRSVGSLLVERGSPVQNHHNFKRKHKNFPTDWCKNDENRIRNKEVVTF